MAGSAIVGDRYEPFWLSPRFTFEIADYAVAEQQIPQEMRVEAFGEWWHFAGDRLIKRSAAPYRGPRWLF